MTKANLTRLSTSGWVAYTEGADDFLMEFEGFRSSLIVNPVNGHSKFHPMPTPAVLDHFYDGTFSRSAQEPTPDTEFTQEVLHAMQNVIAHMRTLGAIAGENFTFHDVGCGYGAGVWAMQKLGAKATGNEANRVWIDQVNGLLDNALTAAPLDKALADLPYKIDFFFCAHVLEHLPNPLWHLKQIAKHISDDGVAYLCMPNAHNFSSLLGGRRCDSAFHFPMHLQYFSPRSLYDLIIEAGLEPLIGNTRLLNEQGRNGAWPIQEALDAGEVLPVDINAWNEAQCRNWLGSELFMVAAKPDNPRLKRNKALRQEVDNAYDFFAACSANRLVKRISAQTNNSVLFPGRSIAFGVGKPGSAILRSGWKEPENGFVWTIGKTSSLQFAIAADVSREKEVELRFHIVPLIRPPLLEAQLIHVSIGKVVRKSWRADKGGWYSLTVPAVYLASDSIMLRFEVPGACSLKVLGFNDNETVLGFQLLEMLLVPE
jgi:2-polyprenyl-3-methyl-5-hydroxy-6-metoxy-1,4-benzoquinol methylase